jgi:hypothetical protein
MLDALRAGDVARLVANPWVAPSSAHRWQQGLGMLGTAVAARKVVAAHSAGASTMAKVAAREAIERHSAPTLAADAVQLVRETVPETEAAFDMGGLRLDGATFQCLDLSAGGRIKGLTLQNCEIGELVVPPDAVDGVFISTSYIHRISGCARLERLPSWIQTCDVAQFDSYSTNAQILDSDELSMPLRVAMTILRKLYLQRGRGRKENALFRGIGQSGQHWVEKVLEEVSRQGMATRIKTGGGEAIWHSVAGMRRRVTTLLDAPASSQDPIVVNCRRLAAR